MCLTFMEVCSLELGKYHVFELMLTSYTAFTCDKDEHVYLIQKKIF